MRQFAIDRTTAQWHEEDDEETFLPRDDAERKEVDARCFWLVIYSEATRRFWALRTHGRRAMVTVAVLLAMAVYALCENHRLY